LQDVFIDVFGDNSIVLKPEMSDTDIADWDSLMHVNLIINIEKEFKIKFSSREVVSMNQVGNMLEIINKKINR
jgi:acyl carrier protein